MPEVIDLLKQLAVNANHAEKPSGLYFGTVTGISPLEISVDDMDIPVKASALTLTSLVQDFEFDMTVSHETENALDGVSVEGVSLQHRHRYEGKKTFTVHLALKEGERVALLRAHGGQAFLIIDRLRG